MEAQILGYLETLGFSVTLNHSPEIFNIIFQKRRKSCIYSAFCSLRYYVPLFNGNKNSLSSFSFVKQLMKSIMAKEDKGMTLAVRSNIRTISVCLQSEVRIW